MRLFLLLIFIFNFSQFKAQTKGFEFEKCPLQFQESKTDLSLETKQAIDSVWDKLKNEDKVEFNCLSSFELNKLSDKNKYKLSLERSQKVEQYLYEKEISPRLINYNIDYFDHLTNGNCGTKESIAAFKNLKGVISPVLEKGTYFRRSYNSSESNTIAETCQKFKLYPLEKNVIVGEQGTTVMFHPQCFDLDYSKAGIELTVLLCEYYSVKDIVLSGLTTVSNSAILETGGMIYLEVSYNGKKLNLKKDVDIQIVFPFKSNAKKDDMLSFDGEKKDGLINWKANPNGDVINTDKVLELPPLEVESLEYEYEGEGGIEVEADANKFWELDGYLMKTSNLGWINCDRFIEDFVPTELIVKVKSEEKNFGTRIIFTDIKSILPLYDYSPRNEVKHARLPEGKEVYVITYTVLKDTDVVLFASKKIVLGKQKRIQLKPIKMSTKELKTQLGLLTNN